MKPESISEQLMFNTVRLETEAGMGTGFFYNFKVGENIYPTIITNKHVVNHKQDENVKFHLHLREENGESNTSIGIKMNAHWYFHSTKDLCFTFVNPVFEGVKKAYGKDVFFIANDASIMATREKLQELSALEELVMVGYPIGLSDTRNNYPIFRKGYTSAHPAVDFNDDGIGLVDMACFPGSSGSPIFILNEGGYRDKRGNSYFGRSRILLLGILYAKYSGVRPHKEKINISKEIINKTRGAVAPYAAQIFTHLSVVSSRQRSYDWLRCEGLKNEMEM